MFKLFSQIARRKEYNRLFNEALSLSKLGNKEEAFNRFNFLLRQFPADVYVRRQVLNLGEELHKQVELPDLSPKHQL